MQNALQPGCGALTPAIEDQACGHPRWQCGVQSITCQRDRGRRRSSKCPGDKGFLTSRVNVAVVVATARQSSVRVSLRNWQCSRGHFCIAPRWLSRQRAPDDEGGDREEEHRRPSAAMGCQCGRPSPAVSIRRPLYMRPRILQHVDLIQMSKAIHGVSLHTPVEMFRSSESASARSRMRSAFV